MENQKFAISSEAITSAFTPVENLAGGQTSKIEGVTKKFVEAAQYVNEVVPPGPMKTTILNGLLEAKLYAVQAITHGADTWGFAGGGKLPYNG